MHKTLLLLTGLALVAACSTPFETPRIVPATLVVPGIGDTLDAPGVTGVDVISIHGMCNHTLDSWARPAHRELARAFGVPPGDVVAVPAVPGLFRATLDVDGKEVRHYSIVWSGTSAPAKRTLCYDNGDYPDDYGGVCDSGSRQYPFTRAKYNNRFKVTLLNDCLSDVTFYLGEGGKAVRAVVRDALSAIREERRGRDSAPLFFISESLGSKIIHDALMVPEGAFTKTSLADLALAFVPTEIVYMAANQLPLLNLAKADPAELDCGLVDLLNAKRDSRAPRNAEPQTDGEIVLIAFTDPNDLLSYSLDRESCPGHVSVLVSNSPTWFGKIENPLAAHTDYLDNEAVWKLIVDGNAE